LLAALFFLSGTAALTYQVLWLRLLSIVFGVTVYAASTVLASFMAGLALGSYVGGRVGDRVRHPLAVFAAVEIAIGALALAMPAAFDAARDIYVWESGWLPDSSLARLAARFLSSFLLLLVPSMLMGSTLPLIVRSSLTRLDAIGSRIGFLYGANTAGAITGCLVTGFYLIGALGIRRSLEAGALVNVAVGLTALVLSARAQHDIDPTAALSADRSSAAVAPPSRDTTRAILVVAALSGFASLALEIIWFRVLVLFLPATTYAYTTMLAAVLGGIALGSLLVAPMLRRPRDWIGPLAILQSLTAVAILASLGLLFLIYDRSPIGETAGVVSAITILPATLLMGVSFPIIVHLWIGTGPERHRRTAQELGILYAANVCASVIGSIAAGFWLLPWFGSRTSLVGLAALYLVASAILLRSGGRLPRSVYMKASAVLVAFIGLALSLPDPGRMAAGRRNPPGERMFWREEGVQTTASVHVRPMGGRILYLNGLHQANDTAAMVRTHREIGFLPMLVHPDPREALVVGLGGGATAGIMSQHAGTRVDIVELSESVVNSASWFSRVNYDLLRRPNVRVRVDDGRDYLMLTSSRYDVVTADLIQPGHAGAGQVYSREYFQQVAGALKPGGLVLQWVGHRPSSQYKLIARTFLSVFPETTLWVNGTLLLGSREPLTIDRAAFDRKLRDPQTAAAMQEIGVSGFDDLLAMFTADASALRKFVGLGQTLTDDRPMLEYFLSLPAGDSMIDFTELDDGGGPRIANGARPLD
jgi:spermidine synthase